METRNLSFLFIVEKFLKNFVLVIGGSVVLMYVIFLILSISKSLFKIIKTIWVDLIKTCYFFNSNVFIWVVICFGLCVLILTVLYTFKDIKKSNFKTNTNNR